jgi:hypothetical protein
MAVPYTFAGATSSIPLSQLDSNFATTITLGNTAIQLGNTVTTLNNMTFANVTISSVATAFPNNFLANSTITLGNATLTLGSTTSTVGNLTLSNVTISSGNITATLSNCSVANVTSDSASVAGFVGIPQNSQNGAYNVVLGDAGKHIYHPLGQAANTVTIPANSNVAFTIGTTITFINLSANATTIAVTSDTMYLGGTGTTGNRTLAQYGVATAVKITSTAWVISGNGLT